MGSNSDQSAFLEAHASQLQHCPRMHLTALNLPCGKRQECMIGTKCERLFGRVAEEERKPLASSTRETRGTAALRSAVRKSGLTIKAFCKAHGICVSTLSRHLTGQRISRYCLKIYEKKLGIPREILLTVASYSVLTGDRIKPL